MVLVPGRESVRRYVMKIGFPKLYQDCVPNGLDVFEDVALRTAERGTLAMLLVNFVAILHVRKQRTAKHVLLIAVLFKILLTVLVVNVALIAACNLSVVALVHLTPSLPSFSTSFSL